MPTMFVIHERKFTDIHILSDVERMYYAGAYTLCLVKKALSMPLKECYLISNMYFIVGTPKHDISYHCSIFLYQGHVISSQLLFHIILHMRVVVDYVVGLGRLGSNYLLDWTLDWTL